MRKVPGTGIAIALTAVLVWFGEGNHALWPLSWLSPVPVLMLALRRNMLHAGLATFLAWSAGRLSMAAFFVQSLEVPVPTVAFIVLAPAAVVAVCVLLARALVLGGAPWSAVLALPAAWVSSEYLAAMGPNGTFGVRAYSQMKFLPVVQLASLTGVWGVSFLLAFAATGIAVGLHLRRVGMLAVTGGVVLAVLAGGAWRLRAAAPETSSVRVGQAALPETRERIRQVSSGDPAGALAIVDAYGEPIDALAREGAKIVLLPEEIAGARTDDVGRVEEDLSRRAARDGVTVVAGLRMVAEPKGRNVAVVFGPSGALLGTYVKEHLVAGFETPRLEPGADLVVVEAPVRYGVEICKDLDFPALTKRYVDAGVGLLLAPAWDFRDDGWLHASMAVMRGVEEGLPLVRSAQSGELTVTDAYGRVMAQAVTGEREAVQIALVPVGRRATLYARWGDWFAGVSALGLGLLLIRRPELERR